MKTRKLPLPFFLFILAIFPVCFSAIAQQGPITPTMPGGPQGIRDLSEIEQEIAKKEEKLQALTVSIKIREEAIKIVTGKIEGDEKRGRRADYLKGIGLLMGAVVAGAGATSSAITLSTLSGIKKEEDSKKEEDREELKILQEQSPIQKEAVALLEKEIQEKTQEVQREKKEIEALIEAFTRTQSRQWRPLAQ